VNVVAVAAVPWFAARSPLQVKTSAVFAAMVSLEWIVIVIELVDVVEEMRAVVIAVLASVPVHVGVCPLVQIALCDPPAVNVIVPLLLIAIVVVAFSTIFDGVSPIVVSSTSPSIAVIFVTELYVAATLGVTSTLETPVAEIVVTAAVGCAANSEGVLHVKTIAA
jgi:hypothetical protein|tara:strand:+ start:264 stop:758 length:495 start_codon:yes stop_codon:yes gene_type:complete